MSIIALDIFIIFFIISFLFCTGICHLSPAEKEREDQEQEEYLRNYEHRRKNRKKKERMEMF